MSASRRSRRRPGRPVPPPPCRSERIYVRLSPEHLALCRFLLEGSDNLAYLTVLDRFTALARLTFAPAQQKEVRRFLAAVAELVPLTVLPFESP